LSTLVLASPLLVAATPVHTRGIPKNLLSVYTPANGKFTCLDKSAVIDSSRVNDDYCDCADGSDEPGTSACPNTQFYCVNKGSKGKFVSSYVVNDGICDCCDGSDEYASRAHCADTCISDGAEWRKTLQQRIEAAEKGAAKREEYAAQSVEAAASRKTKVAASAAQVEAAKTAREAAEKVRS
jgi:protein kinase C substrate 80K-H